MLATQYFHRLPSTHDMRQIRDRAREAGPKWDAYPGLIWKAFLMRERLRHGANAYSSLYLWQDAQALTGFVAGNGFRFVTDTFGRPQIENWLVIDARSGCATGARSLSWRQEAISLDADLPAACAGAAERNEEQARAEGVYASVVALDTLSWRLIHLVLLANEPQETEGVASYEVLYLAAPGMASLGRG